MKITINARSRRAIKHAAFDAARRAGLDRRKAAIIAKDAKLTAKPSDEGFTTKIRLPK